MRKFIFLLSVFSTVIIISFLFLRNYHQSKNKQNFQFNSDSNILSVNILDNENATEEQRSDALRKQNEINETKNVVKYRQLDNSFYKN